MPVQPMTILPPTDIDVLVCQTCWRADMPDQSVRPGAQPLAKLDNAELPAGVRPRGVDCLSNVKTAAQLLCRPWPD